MSFDMPLTEDFLNPENSVEKNEASSLTTIVLVYFGKKPNDIIVEEVYRGDTKVPKEIFRNGFKARGTSTDILSHIDSSWWSSRESAYISTSTSKEVAATFPKSKYFTREPGFVYEITLQKKAIDVVPIVREAIKKGLMDDSASRYLREKERAVPFRIKSADIKGAWPVEIEVQADGKKGVSSLKEYIPNPHYRSSPMSTVWGAASVVGHGATVIGATIDAVNLYDAFEQSQESGNYHPFFKEGARIIGSWSAAAAFGFVGAQEGAAAGAVLGPIGGLVGAFAGGVAGSIAGYKGGGEIATSGYDAFSGSSVSERKEKYSGTIGLESFLGSDFDLGVQSQPRTDSFTHRFGEYFLRSEKNDDTRLPSDNVHSKVSFFAQNEAGLQSLPCSKRVQGTTVSDPSFADGWLTTMRSRYQTHSYTNQIDGIASSVRHTSLPSLPETCRYGAEDYLSSQTRRYLSREDHLNSSFSQAHASGVSTFFQPAQQGIQSTYEHFQDTVRDMKHGKQKF